VERYQPIVIRVLVACFAAISAALLMGAILIYPGDVGIKQPIPFSHRVHAGNKGIGCVMCHPHALTRPVAGIPPVETCMLCHMRIIIHYPPVEDPRLRPAGLCPIQPWRPPGGRYRLRQVPR
jgi:hypothetical protein